jgi:hypothetical protein
MPIGKVVLNMVVRAIPSPQEVQEVRMSDPGRVEGCQAPARRGGRGVGGWGEASAHLPHTLRHLHASSYIGAPAPETLPQSPAHAHVQTPIAHHLTSCSSRKCFVLCAASA